MSLEARLQRAWQKGGLLSLLLLPVAWVYSALLALRKLLYRLGLKKVEALPVPVVVVGNWIVGGAGKTPTTLALLQLLQRQGLRAGVISRGYGRSDDSQVCIVQCNSLASEVGDEPLLIHLRSGVPVAVGRDRVAAARALLQAHPEIQLLVSDDGLQHWRLPRALSILVFDERGTGNGRLLPAGPLRQPASRKLPPDSLVLYNAPAPTTALPGHLAARALAGAVSLQDWWQGRPAEHAALQALRGTPVLALAGTARPQRFFDMLQTQGLSLTGTLSLPDHADFSPLPWPADTADLVLTEKDAVKLRPEAVGSTRVWVVALDFRPDPAFEQALLERLKPLIASHG
ncbi:tetraacyldisaccharide 4'-kinase [Pelomonas sp. SE-A7]|uniref:tetraacyldisaccharide 4'-kinase n=1 Tax=Pelomonas sp. SE-A7 TaxID=3054953 RepID=UPI00259CDF4A|nr:tetraacyldisaccharide 4'-kinase [Pelomonas sp. SE-A7]MDM4765742.1 tetraacyldisaccharide 4'-kinase [Pelomonas sp. SE-A7]